MACSRGFYGSLPSPQLQGGLMSSHTTRAGSFLASNDSASTSSHTTRAGSFLDSNDSYNFKKFCLNSSIKKRY